MENFKKNFLNLMSNDYFVIPLCIGIALRSLVVFQADFPINDGGMFYTMIRELIANGFKLPLFTSYNLSQIPYAYPPLAFYLVGFINVITKVEVLQLLRFVPLINTILCMFIFYLLSQKWLSKKESFFAILVFSLLPRSFEWEIMGGGVTRSLGMLFYLLTIYVYTFTEKVQFNKRKIFFTGLFLALTVLSHLEWAALSIITLLIITLLQHRNLPSLIKIFILSGIISSPWWGNVFTNHGLAPFLAFLSNGVTPAKANTYPQVLLLDITDEPFVTILGALGILGLFYKTSQKELLLPILYSLPIFLSQRSAPNLVSIPLSMLAGIGLNLILKNIILPKGNAALFKKISISILTLYSMVSLISLLFFKQMFAYYFDNLSHGQREAMSWVKENTPTSAKFIILTSRPDWAWSSDNILEWFPALTERKSITTPQGAEWIANTFNQKADFYLETKECFGKDIICLQEISNKYGEYFDYVYIQKNQEGTKSTSLPEYLFGQSTDYKLVYKGASAKIFERI